MEPSDQKDKPVLDSVVELEEDALKEYLDDQTAVVLDTREKTVFEKGFIVGSVFLAFPSPNFDKFGVQILKNFKSIIIVDDKTKFPAITEDLIKKELGSKIKGYFHYDSERLAGLKLPVKAVGSTDVKELAEILKKDRGSVVLDVRNPNELETEGRVKDVLNIPLGELVERVSEVPKEKNVFMHCARGVRVITAHSILTRAKYDNISSLICTFEQIKDSGVEIIKN